MSVSARHQGLDAGQQFRVWNFRFYYSFEQGLAWDARVSDAEAETLNFYDTRTVKACQALL